MDICGKDAFFDCELQAYLPWPNGKSAMLPGRYGVIPRSRKAATVTIQADGRRASTQSDGLIVIFDETHNMLSGTYSDQRPILTQLRYGRCQVGGPWP
jgi:hypothetical protein